MNERTPSGSPAVVGSPPAGTAASHVELGFLDEAIERGTEVVVSHRGPNGWQTQRSRFLARDGQGQHLILAPFANDPGQGAADSKLTLDQLVGVTFRRGHKKCMFSTVFEAFQDFTVGGEVLQQAVRLRWPQSVQQLQRRVYYRVAPPGGRPIPVKVTPLDTATKSANAPNPVPLTGTMQDLSAGGIRVRSAQPIGLRMGESVRVVFTPQRGSEPFMLEATYRHCEPSQDGSCSLGFQFVGLETTPQGQATLIRLARTVTEFCRTTRKR